MKKKLDELYTFFGKDIKGRNYSAIQQICKDIGPGQEQILCDYLKKRVTGEVLNPSNKMVLRQPLGDDFVKGIDELKQSGWSISKAISSFEPWY